MGVSMSRESVFSGGWVPTPTSTDTWWPPNRYGWQEDGTHPTRMLLLYIFASSTDENWQ